VDDLQARVERLEAERPETTGGSSGYEGRVWAGLRKINYGDLCTLRTCETPRGKVVLGQFENGQCRVRIEWLGKIWDTLHKSGVEADALFDVVIEEGGISHRWIAAEMLYVGNDNEVAGEAQMDDLRSRLERLTNQQLEVALTL
jgi:hypothetical protein